MTRHELAADHELVERLFAQHAEAVYRYCRLRLENADAHDAVGEVFVSAVRRDRQIPAADLAWLLGVARRVVANLLRAQRRSGALTAKLGLSLGQTAPDVAESVMASDSAYRALAKLRPADREVLLVALSAPLTQAELGLALGCSAKAAGVRLSRARARLDQAVTEAEADDPAPAPAPAQINPAPAAIQAPLVSQVRSNS